MLYENAQLIRAYLHAWQVTDEPFFKQVVTESLDSAAREMTHPNGGFFSSLDADFEGEEGKFYVWTLNKIRDTLKKDSDFFEAECGVQPLGNWEDETQYFSEHLTTPPSPPASNLTSSRSQPN